MNEAFAIEDRIRETVAGYFDIAGEEAGPLLDELETLRICVGYEIDGEPVAGLPVVVDRFAQCEPVYEELPGWQSSTVGITSFDQLPADAQAYLGRMEALAGVPVDIISTGPDREQTIIKQHPFE